MRIASPRSLVPAALIVLALLVCIACKSGPPGTTVFDGGGSWKAAGTQPQPALSDGLDVAWWARGAGPSREKVGVLRDSGGDDVRPADLQELATYCHPIDNPEVARHFAYLARLLRTPGLPIDGDPVEPAPALRGKGGSGSYTRADAEAWGIDFDPPAVPNGGGWLVEQVILVAPWTHPDLKYTSPWRLVWVRGVVYPDGAITVQDERTLTNGEDAQRFARF